MDLPEFYRKIYTDYTRNLLEGCLSKCDKCDGRGYVETEKNMFVDCECVENFNSLKKYSKCGVNAKHIHRNEDWFEAEFKKKSFDFLKEVKGNLKEILRVNFLIYPKYDFGWGASHFGNQIIKYCIDSGKVCAVASSKSIMDLFFSWDNDNLAGCKEYLQWVDVLLIDEFGGEYNQKMKDDKSFVANSFNSFIMERKRLNKTTIISSNFHAKNLKKTYAAEINKVIQDNFAGLPVETKTKRKTEFEALGTKIQNKNIVSAFDNLDFDVPSGRGKKLF